MKCQKMLSASASGRRPPNVKYLKENSENENSSKAEK